MSYRDPFVQLVRRQFIAIKTQFEFQSFQSDRTAQRRHDGPVNFIHQYYNFQKPQTATDARDHDMQHIHAKVTETRAEAISKILPVNHIAFQKQPVG